MDQTQFMRLIRFSILYDSLQAQFAVIEKNHLCKKGQINRIWQPDIRHIGQRLGRRIIISVNL